MGWRFPPASRRIGNVLLGDQHERALRQAAAVDLPFSGVNIAHRATQMHGSRAPSWLIGPRNISLDGEIHDSDARAVLVPRESSANMRGHARRTSARVDDPKSSLRCCVQHDDVVGAGREVVQGSDRVTGRNLPTGLFQRMNKGVGDGLRTALGNGPAAGMCGGGEHHPDGGRAGARQRPKPVCSDAGEECASFRGQQ